MSFIVRTGLAALLFLLLAGCDTASESSSNKLDKGTRLEGVVVDYVKDGDSFTAFVDGRKIEVRLFGIDSPEKNQPYAAEARKTAVKLLGDSTIELVVKDRDRYQRVVADAFVSNSLASVNQELVEQGAAWVYRKYSTAQNLLAAESEARKNKRGLWSLPASKRIEPWLWRQKEK